LDAAKAEAKAWKTIWSAGQGVTSIKDCPSVSKLISDLKSEFIDSIKEQSQLLENFK
jgi:nitronate monooxygenase